MHVTYLHLLAINFQGTDSEIDTDGVLLLLHEDAGLESLDHTGLPHIGVPDQDDFKKKVERVLNLRPCRLHGEGSKINKQNALRPKHYIQDLGASMQLNWFHPCCVNNK